MSYNEESSPKSVLPPTLTASLLNDTDKSLMLSFITSLIKRNSSTNQQALSSSNSNIVSNSNLQSILAHDNFTNMSSSPTCLCCPERLLPNMVYCPNCWTKLTSGLAYNIIHSLASAHQNKLSDCYTDISSMQKTARCSNCDTNKTTMWRRDNSNRVVCNACGLYLRLRGVNRPKSMKQKDIIPRRKRNPRLKTNEGHNSRKVDEECDPPPSQVSAISSTQFSNCDLGERGK